MKKAEDRYFTETKTLLALIRALADNTVLMYDGVTPVDLARIPWPGKAASVLGQISRLVSDQAAKAGLKWDAGDQEWVDAGPAEPTPRRAHRMVNTDEHVAFLRCENCALEHTVGSRIGKQVGKGAAKFFWRMSGSEQWTPYPRPPCPGNG